MAFVTSFAAALGAPPEPTRQPTHRVVDLALDEMAQVVLANGKTVQVKLKAIDETRDTINDSVRLARVTVEVDGRSVELESGNYRLPRTIGFVQIDVPITRGYKARSGSDKWGLLKDARLRLWPAGTPWIEPGLFMYPLKQRWFASGTQMSNEPVFVNAGEGPGRGQVYYHNDLDFGGCEGMVDVVFATDGLVVTARNETLPGYEQTPVRPRPDVVYIVDDRGWYYRYSHLFSIDDVVRPGARVKMGQKVGVLGKEGSSGGWSHLHFGIQSRQPSGKWGTEDSYAFVWQAYIREHQPRIIAVARPHHVAWAGEPVTLDGTRSWSSAGNIGRFEWTFTDGTTANGAQVKRTYSKPGTYSEILKVTGPDGEVAYDFAVTQVFDRTRLDQLPPSIQAAYAPSLDVRKGQPVTFKVRSFRTTHGMETWDFGDGSAAVTTKSDGNVKALAKDGFAATTHRFAQAGDYIVRVQRSNERGETAIAHLAVRVGE